MPGLGRIHSVDINDTKFSVRKALAQVAVDPAVAVRYWEDDIWWGDQGETSECVGYSWTHWLEDGPVVYDHSDTPPPVVKPNHVYEQARFVDEWPGEDYDGTSVRAGAKVLQSLGYIEQYLWAWDAATVAEAVLNVGPVVVGTDWYEDMFFPRDSDGRIFITGRIAGGHAYLINGYDSTTGVFRVKNSWGKSWGKDGHAFITFSDLDFLIRTQGEACLAVERKIIEPDPLPEVVPEPEPEPEPIPPIPNPAEPDIIIPDPPILDPEPDVEPVPVPVEPEPTPDVGDDIEEIKGFFVRLWRKFKEFLGL